MDERHSGDLGELRQAAWVGPGGQHEAAVEIAERRLPRPALAATACELTVGVDPEWASLAATGTNKRLFVGRAYLRNVLDVGSLDLLGGNTHVLEQGMRGSRGGADEVTGPEPEQQHEAAGQREHGVDGRTHGVEGLRRCVEVHDLDDA